MLQGRIGVETASLRDFELGADRLLFAPVVDMGRFCHSPGKFHAYFPFAAVLSSKRESRLLREADWGFVRVEEKPPGGLLKIPTLLGAAVAGETVNSSGWLGLLAESKSYLSRLAALLQPQVFVRAVELPGEFYRWRRFFAGEERRAYEKHNGVRHGGTLYRLRQFYVN